MSGPDAVVVGAGPNGLAAALTLARAGLGVEVYEQAPTAGGGCRTAELTIDGFHHDVCSAVHPLLLASPFFRGLDLASLGVEVLQPEVAFAHPLDGGRAGAVAGSVADTAETLGSDRPRYRRLLAPVVASMDPIVSEVLGPLRSLPRHPLALGRFAGPGLLPAASLARLFATDEARALLAGVAAHSMLPLSAPVSAAFGLLLAGLGHAVGWPVVRGGSARITDALVAELALAGGRVITEAPISSLKQLPKARVTLLDVSPRALVALAGDALPARRRRGLAGFAYGPGVCKVDWALSAPVPWEAEVCRRTATVHVGGSLDEVIDSEARANAGQHAGRPFCIVVQPSVVDPTRAPTGQHTLWAYCHVPSGSDVDMTGPIEAQIERFAPGFRDLILARATRRATDTERDNPNYVGGDINGGRATLRQTVARPTLRWDPYATGLDGVYLCSASTPPGGGVHGMCGYLAATRALRGLAQR